jgi:GNAT superfamily N-acetyltransferase
VIVSEIVPPATGKAFLAMKELRTQLADEDEFVRRVDEVQRPEGYRLVGAFEDDEVVAVAGFRSGNNLAWGRFLYVDDLATRREFRRRGYGRALLVWLGGEAARLGCEQVHLDSGVGFDRAEAHRVYLNAGFVISAHHFARRL